MFKHLAISSGNGRDNIIVKNPCRNRTGFIVITTVLTVLLVCTALIGSASAFAGGDGSSGNPYQITNATELQSMKDYTGHYFILNNDIDCSGVSSWTPIGEYATTPTYQSHLNGNGKTIKNLTFSTSTEYAGIFGCVTNGFSLSNCTFDNIEHNSEEYNTSIICGGVYGASTPVTITNVTLQNSKESAEKGTVGGIVGKVHSSTLTCSNCDIKNSMISSSDAGVGGIMGMATSYSTCTLDNCKSENCLLKVGFFLVGGIVGTSESYATLIINSNCESKNNIITCQNYDSVGGILGWADSHAICKISEGASAGNGVKVTNCYLSSPNYAIGGVLGGESSSTVEIDGAVVSSCNVISTYTSSCYAGGIAGKAKTSELTVKNPTVKNCSISGKGYSVGGVVGGWS